MQKIKEIISEDIFFKDYIYKYYSKNFYGYLKSTKSEILVNNIIVDINCNLKINDLLEINYCNKEKNTAKIKGNINILYEDEYYIIVDKESNLLTIPSFNEVDSLYSRLIYHYPNDSINILTRLDKVTSGIVIACKKSYLVNKTKITHKEYNAKTNNYLPYEEGIINLPIKKSNSIKRIIDKSGKESITHYKLIDKENYIYSLILKTGRTHQIRVHLAYFNCSIIGDKLYGGSFSDELKLVCKQINFFHPIKEIEIVINSKLGVE